MVEVEKPEPVVRLVGRNDDRLLHLRGFSLRKIYRILYRCLQHGFGMEPEVELSYRCLKHQLNLLSVRLCFPFFDHLSYSAFVSDLCKMNSHLNLSPKAAILFRSDR